VLKNKYLKNTKRVLTSSIDKLYTVDYNSVYYNKAKKEKKMLSVNISGRNVQEVAREAIQFANLVLGISPSGQEIDSVSENFWDGYRPNDVGRSEYTPVDDGREWNIEALKEWIESLRPDGRLVVKLLAREKLIDQREEARKLNWSGSKWAGVWTGPRRQAGYVKDSHGLSSWPYGHTYYEPRRMWMHEAIAVRVLSILGDDN